MTAPYRHLLVPTDGSELSTGAVRAAVEFAQGNGARIHFLHARPKLPLSLIGAGPLVNSSTVEDLSRASREASERTLEEAMAIAEAAGVVAAAEVVDNEVPYQAIIAAAQRHHCDLIFMASHGRRGLSNLLLGSQTLRVLTHTTLPVLVSREPTGPVPARTAPVPAPAG
jgi:nucleotide-binding universal stress UspA family protein